MTEVVSYGHQIGWLSEIVLALANKQPLPQETVLRLEQACKDIEAIKQDVQPSAPRA